MAAQAQRATLLRLLQGSQRAMQEIEAAVRRYQEARAAIRLRSPARGGRNRDAEALHQALQTLVRIASEGGAAWTGFLGQSAAIDQLAPSTLGALQDLASEPGHALVDAASRSARNLAPTRGRPISEERILRLQLISSATLAAARTGLHTTISGAGRYRLLIEGVFEIAGIPQSPDHDVRHYLRDRYLDDLYQQLQLIRQRLLDTREPGNKGGASAGVVAENLAADARQLEEAAVVFIGSPAREI